ASAASSLRVRHVSFDDITRATWDALVARTPAATAFSRWAFHRAWWDAYGGNAHDQTLLVERPGAIPGSEPVAIVPFMHRHEVEPTDDAARSTLRHGADADLTPVPPTAKAIFFGASYHADYATVLTAPDDLPAVARALVDHLSTPSDPGEPHPAPWDVVDLRRLRCADPAADALTDAFEGAASSGHWQVVREQEDVCPVVTLPDGVDFEGYLDTLDKKARHEIRRKLRRAEATGDVVLSDSADPLGDLDTFIDLHQRKWGDRGLFPATTGGASSRIFIRRLFEEFGPEGPVKLSILTVGGRRIAAGIHIDDGDSFLYYNAGVDPDARDLSPGVVMVGRYVAAAIAAGRHRIDFLRGNEGYKYEWGAVDEPIQRILVRRTEG
ncbi:MAG TPA: GNAT family N-acetyltransferase, partial [Candidatus Acidoferrum sp.]|nr:GNAT family N-acetyltransferase [Candidatus Acidoferrum sp.]